VLKIQSIHLYLPPGEMIRYFRYNNYFRYHPVM
jgi:hypothetical protein